MGRDMNWRAGKVLGTAFWGLTGWVLGGALLLVATTTCRQPENDTAGSSATVRKPMVRALMTNPHELSGTVFGGGAPMPGTLVEALTNGTTTAVAASTTDASGSYSLLLDDATYDLRIVPALGTSFESQSIQNVVINGNNKRHDIVLIAEGGVVAGKVRGYGGVSLAGVSLHVYDANNWVTSVVTDMEGNYRISLGAGLFRFYLGSSNLGVLEGAPNGNWQESSYNHKIEGTTTLDFNLPIVKVQGAIKGATGQPVPNVTVFSSAHHSSLDGLHYTYYEGSTKSDANGQYELLIFKGNENSLAVAPPTPFAAVSEMNVVVEGDLICDFILTPSVVSGHVYGESGVLPGVTVQVLDRNDPWSLVVASTTTNDKGYYQLNLALGNYTFKLSSPVDALAKGVPNGEWIVSLNNQETSVIHDFLLPVAEVAGVVTDSAGAPLPNVAVSSTARDWSPSSFKDFATEAKTDASGQYSLWVFTGESVSFTVTPTTPLPRLIQTGVTVANNMNRDFVIPKSGVSGKVLGYNGIGISEVRILILARSSGKVLYSTTTDADGNYQLDLGPGNYYFQLSLWSAQNGVPNGYLYVYLYNQEVSDTFNFIFPAAEVSGVVTDSNGAPVPNALVSSSGGESTELMYSQFSGNTLTDANGQYKLLVLKGARDTVTITPTEMSGFSMTVLSNVEVTDDFFQTVILEKPDFSAPMIVSDPRVVHVK